VSELLKWPTGSVPPVLAAWDEIEIEEMNMQIKTIVLAAALSGVPGLLHAQFDFNLAGRKVQVHSFGSQGYMYSNDNNYMTVPTSKGSFAFTDGGANISTQVTDKFRVGAQVYLRNVGELGNWRPELDWAFGDYKFKSWFGIRGGKVKTTLGLYSDIQDMDSLHTFALLPQSIYPLDWRSTTIAHSGGDVYGDIKVKRLGTFSYTGYAGKRPQDRSSGYEYASRATIIYNYLGGLQVGGDLRWTTPFGAVFGASYLKGDISGRGTLLATNFAYHQDTTTDGTAQYYGQYAIKGLRLDVEYRRNVRDVNLYRTPIPTKSIVDVRAYYVQGAYRVSKHLELSAYRSKYFVDTRKNSDPPTAHEFDTAIGGRIDLTNHWYMKIEGHFIDGAPVTPSASRGFYALSNPNGILPATQLLVLRTGFSF
jgi:hypothetical protein